MTDIPPASFIAVGTAIHASVYPPESNSNSSYRLIDNESHDSTSTNSTGSIISPFSKMKVTANNRQNTNSPINIEDESDESDEHNFGPDGIDYTKVISECSCVYDSEDNEDKPSTNNVTSHLTASQIMNREGTSIDAYVANASVILNANVSQNFSHTDDISHTSIEKTPFDAIETQKQLEELKSKLDDAIKACEYVNGKKDTQILVNNIKINPKKFIESNVPVQKDIAIIITNMNKLTSSNNVFNSILGPYYEFHELKLKMLVQENNWLIERIKFLFDELDKKIENKYNVYHQFIIPHDFEKYKSGHRNISGLTLDNKFLCHHNITNDPSSKFENEKLPYYVYDTFLKYFMIYIKCIFAAYKARAIDSHKTTNAALPADPVIYQNVLLDLFDNGNVIYNYSVRDENDLQSLTRDEISELYMEKNIKHVNSNNKFRTCDYHPTLLPFKNDVNSPEYQPPCVYNHIEKEIHDLTLIRNWFIFANNNLIKYTQPMEVITNNVTKAKITIIGIPDFEFPEYLQEFKYEE